MVVGKKTSKSKKSKTQSSSQHQHQHQQSSSSADCLNNLKDDVPLASSVSSRGELHENPIELGYNSGDEYDRANAFNISAKEIDEIEIRFEKKMRKKGFIIKKMAEDGACLFRAVADQIYGDQEMHQALRKLCMDYMAKNSDYFSHYVTEDFNEYIKRKRLNSCHGNHVEIQALSEMFNRPIEVYHYNCEPINIFQGCNQAENEPIRLSYHQNVHYNSVVDPYKATVGVGLGFPSFKPGLAEKNLLEKAMRISEDQELEQVMLEDKIKLTDWEATNEAIEEQIARESYVQWLKENERKISSKSKKVKFTATATATTASYTNLNNSSNSNNLTNSNSPKQHWSESTSDSSKQKSPRLSPINRSPKACSSGLNNSNYSSYSNFVETGSFVNQFPNQFSNQFPPQMFGLNDWNSDGDILRQVIAQSQEEYLDSLKRKAKEINSENRSSSPELSGCTSGSPNKKLKVNRDLDKQVDNETESKDLAEKTDHKDVKEIANEKIVNDKNEVKNDELKEESVNKEELIVKEVREDKEANDFKEDKEVNEVKDDKLLTSNDENLESLKQ